MQAHARATDPETSHQAAEAITPGLPQLQARVERYAIDAGPRGFTDLQMCADFGDPSSTYRTRRSELTDRNIILDSGKRRLEGDSARQRVVWVHRSHAAKAGVMAPPLLPPPPAAAQELELKREARALAAQHIAWAQQMRAEGRAMFADHLEAAAGVLAQLAA